METRAFVNTKRVATRVPLKSGKFLQVFPEKTEFATVIDEESTGQVPVYNINDGSATYAVSIGEALEPSADAFHHSSYRRTGDAAASEAVGVSQTSNKTIKQTPQTVRFFYDL